MLKKCLLTILVACILTIEVNSQYRTSEYDEFYFNLKRAYTSFGFIDISEDEQLIKELSTIINADEKQKRINTWLEKYQVDITNLAFLAKANFDKAKSKDGFQYRNMYLLEDLSNTDYPISSLLEKLNDDVHSISEFPPRKKYIYATNYLLMSLKFLDNTDSYNFTTIIILKKASRELHEVTLIDVDDFM